MVKHACAVALVAVTAYGVAAMEPVKSVVASYLEIQVALTNDTIDGVRPAAQSIGQEAAKMGAEGAPIAKAAGAVAAAADLDAARAAFGPLSDAVIAAVKADPAAHGVRRAYCPMAKASWLQKEEKIRNPYYGSSMLSCGEFQAIDK
jgi:hypothetical protein